VERGCADCGYRLSAGSANRRKRPEIIDCVVYCCGNYTRYGSTTCSSHTKEPRDLHHAVLADVNYFADMAMNDPKAVKAIRQRLCAVDATEAKAYERERRKLTKRLAELDRLFSALYEDKAMDAISERNYALMLEKYEKEQFEADRRLREIEGDLGAKGISDRGAADFVSLIGEYRGITELTAAAVNALIDKITVSERKKNAEGTVEQCVTIHYKFVGNLHERYIPVPKRVCHLPEKKCARCGKAYSPGSAIALYCPDCREIVAREHAVKSDETRKAKRHAERLQAEKEIAAIAV
jgi:hypothetical protein